VCPVPLSADNFVQESTGWATVAASAAFDVTLPAGTAAGNTVLVIITSNVSNQIIPPGGFIVDFSSVLGSSGSTANRKPGVSAAESSWTFTNTSGLSRNVTWYVVELSGLELVLPLDATATSGASAAISDGGTRSTTTTPENSGLSTLQLAVFGWRNATTAGAGSWSGYTNGFSEVVDHVDAAGSGEHYGHGIARRFEQTTTGAFECTATFAGPGDGAWAMLLVYRAADSPIRAPLFELAGFDWGTHGGVANTTSVGEADKLLGAAPTGTWGTHYLIQAASGRNDGYGLRIAVSSAICYVPLRIHPTGTSAPVYGLNLRMVSATGTVVVAEGMWTSGLATLFQVLYDAAANKFGVRWDTAGTPAWQSGTTAPGTWVWIDLRPLLVKNTAGDFVFDWRLETAAGVYTDQPAATTTSVGATELSFLRLGGNVSQTMTCDYDDVVGSRFSSAYPLGPHKVALVTVDAAGTPSVSGTAANFSVFTSNGTLGAWNAANARNALDEVPPTISAAADGVCQTAAAAADYMEFPMADPTVAADEYVSGVRLLAAMWGGTGSGTGTLGIRGHDGTTEATLIPATTSYDAASPTAVSATDPLWLAKLWQPSGGWTTTKINAAVVRVGFSSDATPDMGVHVVYLEVAKGKTRTMPMFGVAGDVTVDARLDPNSLGVRSLFTATPEGKPATLHYELSGTPTDVSVPAAASDTQTLDAADAPTTNYVALYPDPEGVADT
jgi:hypothetical protein